MSHVRSNVLRARKPHQCDGCLGEIEVGERYWRNVHVADEHWYVTKLHQWCVGIVDRMLRERGEETFESGDTFQWALDNGEEWTQGPGPWRPPRMDGKPKPGGRSDG